MRTFSVGVIQWGQESNIPFQHINVGIMLRTAVLFGVKNFYIIGDYGFDKRFAYGDGLQNSLINNDIKINNILCDNLDVLVEKIKTISNKVILCTPNVNNCKSFDINNVSEEPLFVFGSEQMGIDSSIIDTNIFETITVPQSTKLSSYNSSVAMTAICFKYGKPNW